MTPIVCLATFAIKTYFSVSDIYLYGKTNPHLMLPPPTVAHDRRIPHRIRPQDVMYTGLARFRMSS